MTGGVTSAHGNVLSPSGGRIFRVPAGATNYTLTAAKGTFSETGQAATLRAALKLTAAAARFLQALANLPDSGALGLAVRLVEFATMLAEHQRATSLDLPLLKAAMTRGLAPARAELLAHRLADAGGNGQAAIARAG
jgi:hypothetical protein